MASETFLVIAAQYQDEKSALADYDAVKSIYHDMDLIDTFDAAVVSKNADGKVTIVKRHEQPTRDAAKGGTVVGLAVGALVALFPAVGIGAGLLWGGAAGAGLGALAGHAVAGLSRADLKDLGELLDEGESGFLLVAAAGVKDKVATAFTRADKKVEKELRADPDAVAESLVELQTTPPAG